MPPRPRKTTMFGQLADRRRVPATQEIHRSAAGLQGPAGDQGDPGRDAGLAYSFDTSTSMADPGSGDIRFNNGTIASVTAIAISDTDDEANDQDGFLDTWDDSSSTVKGLLVLSTADGQLIVFEVTAITDQGTWHQATVVHRSGTLPSNDEALKVLFVRTGDAGAAGGTGAAGRDAGLAYSFDTNTTIADPGSGDIRFDDGTAADVTEIAISDTDDELNNLDGLLDTWDDSTSSVRGRLEIVGDSGQTTVFNITGAITDEGSWHRIPVGYVSGLVFDNNEALSVLFVPKGDKGDQGEQGETGAAGADGSNPPDFKSSVRAATTANITISTALNNGDSLDGVTLATNDRVLVKNQSSSAENGIYIVGVSPGRATDADAAGELSGGTQVYVEEGTVNADTLWVITTNGSITPGTTAHSWGLIGKITPVNSTVEDLKVLRGVIDTSGSGSILEGSGFTITRHGTGDVTINYTSAFSDTPSLQLTVEAQAAADFDVYVHTRGTGASSRVNTVRADTGAAFDRVFHFLAIGPR